MKRKRRRNPDVIPKAPVAVPAVAAPRRRSLGGLKNWLILGGFIAGGYYVFKYFQSPAVAELKSELAVGSGGAGPDLNGPYVSQFQIESTQTTNCISAPVPGFIYAPITSYNPITKYNTFSATANGHFTRRLLCKGNQRWAEIHPA